MVCTNEQSNGITFYQNSKDYCASMIKAIDVERIDSNRFQSKELWQPAGLKGAYGGQIVAQALHAAWNTCEEQFAVHSLHSYFIMVCDIDTPVVYNVQKLREGRSFVTRQVTATQNNKIVFICSCSFSAGGAENSLNYQIDMPNVLDAEEVDTNLQAYNKLLNTLGEDAEKSSIRAQQKLEEYQPLDYRNITTYLPEEAMTGNSTPNPNFKRWFKTRGEGHLNDNLKLHACIIAYASDFGFVNIAARANGFSYSSRSIGLIASLDHSIWFHSLARADEWLLYDVNCPHTSNERGITFGKIYTHDGQLIASTAQEGIMKLSKAEIKRRKDQTESQQGVVHVSKL